MLQGSIFRRRSSVGKRTRHRCNLRQIVTANKHGYSPLLVTRASYVPYTLRDRASGKSSKMLNHGCSTITISLSDTKSWNSILSYRRQIVKFELLPRLAFFCFSCRRRECIELSSELGIWIRLARK